MVVFNVLGTYVSPTGSIFFLNGTLKSYPALCHIISEKFQKISQYTRARAMGCFCSVVRYDLIITDKIKWYLYSFGELEIDSPEVSPFLLQKTEGEEGREGGKGTPQVSPYLSSIIVDNFHCRSVD